jgi:hypothetical protein
MPVANSMDRVDRPVRGNSSDALMAPLGELLGDQAANITFINIEFVVVQHHTTTILRHRSRCSPCPLDIIRDNRAS